LSLTCQPSNQQHQTVEKKKKQPTPRTEEVSVDVVVMV
jgi:hypothetical protein